MKKKAIGILLSALCAAFVFTGCGLLPFQEDVPFTKQETPKAEVMPSATPVPEAEPTEEPQQEPVEETSGGGEQNEGSPLEQARLMATQYDYDGAIELLKGQPDYESNSDMQAAVSEFENTKATCVEYPLEQITHVFYHTLIKDTGKAFDGDSDEPGYNQVMTTVDEFNKITQIMYDKGYVLVSPHDMASVNEDGTMTRGRIMLPPGKIPFVLSQDDVSYYHYMDGDGFARRLVLDENGEVKCEYIEDDGSVSVGDYDMVPLIDSFIKEHPDFSYHGRKGILAMTGYNGVLGYRTDIAYKTGENLQPDQKEFLDSHPDFNFDDEVQRATVVAEAMKANGWEFASHTWGHRNATTSSPEELQADNERWEANVAPILGKTDMIIFAFGADIGDWQGYNMDNSKFAYYKSRGYNYYCNVDSNQYWVQITDQYFRQGRRNLDGYRMYYNPEMLSDLFDVSEVWDASRPTPVPPM
ncbi:polysaccharide deacetylase family protein [Blautia schinkii]|nr:polysaccharide deacetylase family protein [Blautia schinkii]